MSNLERDKIYEIHPQISPCGPPNKSVGQICSRQICVWNELRLTFFSQPRRGGRHGWSDKFDRIKFGQLSHEVARRVITMDGNHQSTETQSRFPYPGLQEGTGAE